MMPNVPPPGDPRQQAAPPPEYDDERVSRIGSSEPYSDLKSSMESAFQKATNGMHLSNEQRFWSAKAFVELGLQKLHRMFRDDKELQADISEIREENDAILPPHPTYGASISQGIRVLEIKSPRPDTSVDVPQENLAPGLMDRMLQRDYAEVLTKMLRLVSEVAMILEEHELFHYEMEEMAVEADYEGDE